MPQLEQYSIAPNLLSSKLQAKVTSSVKVTDAAAQKYYNQNKTTFTTPKTREVRHILVNSKSLAEKLEQKLKGGESFAALAKKYSKDTGSAAHGGKLCVAHGTTSGACSQTVTSSRRRPPTSRSSAAAASPRRPWRRRASQPPGPRAPGGPAPRGPSAPRRPAGR